MNDPNTSSQTTAAPAEKPTPFKSVLKEELTDIHLRRSRHFAAARDEPAGPDSSAARPSDTEAGDPELAAVLRAARDRRLVGLAFSGGGIRSATFNLGVLQGLARLKLLPLVDYISTVSGGGYVGAWLAAWIRREGDLGRVQSQLGADQADTPAHAPRTAAPPAAAGAARDPRAAATLDPVIHLRRYSNYLAPRQGYLSADRWVLWATYVRNFLLNQLVLLPAVLAVLLGARAFLVLYYPWSDDLQSPGLISLGVMGTLCAAAWTFWLIAWVVILVGTLRVWPRGSGRSDRTGAPIRPRGQMTAVLLLLAGAVLFCACTPYDLQLRRWLFGATNLAWAAALADCASFAIPCMILAGLSFWIAVACRGKDLGPNHGWQWRWQAFVVVCLAGLAGGALLHLVYLFLHGRFTVVGLTRKDHVPATALVLAVGPPLVLWTIMTAVFLGVALSTKLLGEELREWWSSLCGRLLMAATGWLGLVLLALYATPLVLWAGPWVAPWLGSGWLLTVVGGVLAGGGSRTGGQRVTNRYLDLLAQLAPWVFMAGLLVVVSLLLHVVLDVPPNWEKADPAVWTRHTEPNRPPTQVVASAEANPDRPEAPPARSRKEVVQYTKKIDDTEIAQQVYWSGILNGDGKFVPKVVYSLTPADLQTLAKKDGVAQHILHGLALPGLGANDLRFLVGLLGAPLGDGPLLGASALVSDRTLTFVDEAALAQALENASDRDRDVILQRAKTVQLINPDQPFWMICLKWLAWGAAFVALTFLFGWIVDVNLFSLHAVYGNRLVRCYLGASRPSGGSIDARRPDPVTDFDPDDDLPLADLRIRDGGYDGPFVLVNAAMNLLQGDRLDWQERKAEAFVFTPLFCGNTDTGYRRTKPPAQMGVQQAVGYGGDVKLGTAVAISGAAASPNMGAHSSPAVTALLTVFNARLGAWLGNPASPTRWNRAGPRIGFVHLFRELFGMTRKDGGYVYLSDGGHFEDLGVYELVRRRCRYVIACDAGADPESAFEDLSNLIHKCRVDLGVEIEIDLDSLHRDENGRTRWHCAVGRIRYPEPGRAPGTLIYIKPSLTGDEPTDIFYRTRRDSDFPNDPTIYQFYNESQFESYRALGQHTADKVFRESVEDMEEDLARDGVGRDDATHRKQCEALFSAVVRRWFAMPPEYETSFVQSTQAFVALQETFREDPLLRRLTLELYPEIDLDQTLLHALTTESAANRANRRAAELHTVLQMFQAMENSWLSLNLDVHYAHPLNRGWIDIFHRWTNAETVRDAWPFLRSEFCRGFVSFCEKQMGLGEVTGRPVRMGRQAGRSAGLARLCRELQEQWPVQWEKRLESRIERAQQGRLPGWLIYPQRKAADKAAAGLQRMACGIILLSPRKAAGEFEFFVWVRGAYRNSGVGRGAVRAVLKKVPKVIQRRWPAAAAGRARLVVHLPVANVRGPGGELQMRMWETFYYHQGFTQAALPASLPASKKYIVLERWLDLNPAAGSP